MAEPILSIEGLTVQYGASITAVRKVDLSLVEGQPVALIGVNGAGKTSLIMACSGLLSSQPARVTEGRVVLAGRDITRKSPNAVTKAGLSIVPERDKVFAHLTIGEHLVLAGGDAALASLGPLPKPFERLLSRRRAQAGSLSGGERQLLALLSALMQRPRVLAVDEFTLGLSPAAIAMAADVAEWARESQVLTLVVVDQNLTLVQRLCERLVVMRGGSIVADGLASEFNADLVKELHLR